MNIHITIPSEKLQVSLSEVVGNQSSRLGSSKFTVQALNRGKLEANNETSAIIIEASNIKDYSMSLELLENLIKPLKIPFIYISHVQNIQIEKISDYFPDQMLLAPFNKETLNNVIYLFLRKISHGYFSLFKKIGQRNKLWLSLRKGVFISLEAEEIKYIESEDHYIKIHSEKQSLPLIKSSLSGFYEKNLDSFGHFYCLSRFCVINMHKIKKIENNQLYIDPNKPLSIPKGKRDEVLEIVGI